MTLPKLCSFWQRPFSLRGHWHDQQQQQQLAAAAVLAIQMQVTVILSVRNPPAARCNNGRKRHICSPPISQHPRDWVAYVNTITRTVAAVAVATAVPVHRNHQPVCWQFKTTPRDRVLAFLDRHLLMALSRQQQQGVSQKLGSVVVSVARCRRAALGRCERRPLRRLHRSVGRCIRFGNSSCCCCGCHCHDDSSRLSCIMLQTTHRLLFFQSQQHPRASISSDAVTPAASSNSKCSILACQTIRR
jgi:hypothetical protein